ncbi:hypothetical protein E2C01_022131 [Portunus trituberculatus]|uniref:Uncharacterized protein n=1 Tax=Portunus trituberculatus TaxID=210409 RepID=A0A5B7E574_PORTR|nr:hypothetical protein [Portunus trituberculatus]
MTGVTVNVCHHDVTDDYLLRRARNGDVTNPDSSPRTASHVDGAAGAGDVLAVAFGCSAHRSAAARSGSRSATLPLSPAWRDPLLPWQYQHTTAAECIHAPSCFFITVSRVAPARLFVWYDRLSVRVSIPICVCVVTGDNSECSTSNVVVK